MSEPISINGNEVWATVVERGAGLAVTLDYDEWRGLRLYLGQRLPVRRNEKADRWLYVTGETPIPGESCRVDFAAKYDGPVEEPETRPRPERRARAPQEYRYKADVIGFPTPPEDRPAAAAVGDGTVIPFPGVKESPPPPAVLAIDQGGKHADLLRIGEEWLRMYKPGSRYAVFLNDEGEGVPFGRVTIHQPGGASA